MPRPNPIAQFIDRLAASLADGTFVRVVLSQPVGEAGGLEKVLGRWVDLKGGAHLSFTFRYPTRDVTRNQPVPEGTDWIREQLRDRFRSALLGTTKRDWQFRRDESGRMRIVSHKPASTVAPARAHDQPHVALLDESAWDWLGGLGVLNERGQVRPGMTNKHSQINRYLEIFSHLAKDCGWIGAAPTGERSVAGADDALTIVDMGCGKGYLTFGVWHLFQRVWQRPVRVIGIEARPDLVATTNALARRIRADDLEFVTGTIATAPLPAVAALIALHACDTATDDAIRRGIELGAQLIVVAPCCHKEVRPQLGQPPPLAPVLRHGVMTEHLAEWATDGLRALVLEWAGYRTKLCEFVASEHTPKNLMIAAVRAGEPGGSIAARERIEEFKTFFGIGHHALDPVLRTDS